MASNTGTDKWRTSLARSAVFRAVGLSLFGVVAWFWLFSTDGPPWRTTAFIAIQALAVLLGVAWYLRRTRAEKRWRAALERYAEQSQAEAEFSRQLHALIEEPNHEHDVHQPFAQRARGQ